MEVLRPMADSPAFEVLTSIRRIVRAVSLHSRRLGRMAGLTVPQLVTLRAVAQAGPGGTTASDILDDVGVSPGTLSGIVQRLVTAGLLQRARSQHDRRRVVLTLTGKGHTLVSSSPAPLQAMFTERFNALSPSERDALVDALERIVEMMEAEDLDASPILTTDSQLSSDG